MGDRDLVKPLLERRGSVHFGRVLMKPGKPLTFATVPPRGASGRALLVFGLPGNPVAPRPAPPRPAARPAARPACTLVRYCGRRAV
jgi:molybdopterin biosynthesis enzyme